MPDPSWFHHTREHSDFGSSQSPPCSGRVTLHVYDANWSRASSNVNAVLRRLGGGAFHVGVEVFGKEWSYAITNEVTGVTRVKPGAHPHHVYREAVELGNTHLMADEVNHLVVRLGEKWVSNEYHPLRHNCCMFCAELCRALGVQGLPEWVTRLQETGLAIDKTVGGLLAFPKLFFCQTQDLDIPSLKACGTSTAESCMSGDYGLGPELHQKIPRGWQVAYSTQHQRMYYYNRKENRSQWELPAEPKECLAGVIEIGQL
jgi:hypothetical protein